MSQVCPAGSGLDSDSQCVACADNTYNDGTSDTCQTCDQYTSAAKDACSSSCPTGQVETKAGSLQCACDAGSELSGTSCVACALGKASSVGGTCESCEEGYVATPDQDSCIAADTCPGTVISDAQCVCGDNQVFNSTSNECQCAPGYRAKNDTCELCDDGKYSVDGVNCIPCTSGLVTALDKSGCVSTTTCETDPFAQADTDGGYCYCKSGTEAAVIDGVMQCVCTSGSVAGEDSCDVCDSDASQVANLPRTECQSLSDCTTLILATAVDNQCTCGDNAVIIDGACTCPIEYPYVSVDKTQCIQECPDGATPVADEESGLLICTCTELIDVDGVSCISQESCGNKLLATVGDGQCVCDDSVAVADTSKNTCICAEGTYLSIDRETCVTECESDTKPQEDGRICICPNDQLIAPDSSCIDYASCTGLATVDEDLYMCVCAENTTYQSGACVCAEGTYTSLDGLSCVTECPTNATASDGTCKCNDAYEPTSTNTCQKCDDGYVSTDGAACQSCTDGVASFDNTSCISVEDCESLGGEDNNGQCQCPSGSALEDGKCSSCDGVINVDGTCAEKCPDNSTAVDNKCECNAGYAPEDAQCSQCSAGWYAQGGDATCTQCGSDQVSNFDRSGCVSTTECEETLLATVNCGGCECIANAALDDTGVCACEEGYVVSIDMKSCILEADCEYTISDGACVCPTGQSPTSDGQCQGTDCGNLQTQTDDGCVCVENTYIDSDGACACLQGFLESDNACVGCGSDEVLNLAGDACIALAECQADIFATTDEVNEQVICVCIENAEASEEGVCQCIESAFISLDGASCITECPENATNSSGQCVCLDGYNLQDNECIVEEICQAGTGLVDGLCVECADGSVQDGTGNTCVQCTDGCANLARSACIATDECGDHTTVSNNQCFCEDGYTLGESYECVSNKASAFSLVAVALMAFIVMMVLTASAIAMSVVARRKRSAYSEISTQSDALVV